MQSAGRKGDESSCPADAHQCPSCPHAVRGQATQGSGNVLINRMPALRLGDLGEHAECCGSQQWVAAAGEGSVLINNRPAHRKGDAVKHCGGAGALQTGSADVFIGRRGGEVPKENQTPPWIELRPSISGRPMMRYDYELEFDSGEVRRGRGAGRVREEHDAACSVVRVVWKV